MRQEDQNQVISLLQFPTDREHSEYESKEGTGTLSGKWGQVRFRGFVPVPK